MKTLIIHSKTLGKKEVYYDDEDEELVMRYTWGIKKFKKDLYYCLTYPLVNGKYRVRRLHRLILGLEDSKKFVDHINHNGLDNRKENLRLVTITQNNRNSRALIKKPSLYKGVTFREKDGKWRARIMVNKKSIHLGYFTSEIEAAIAYNNAALLYFREYAYTNLL